MNPVAFLLRIFLNNNSDPLLSVKDRADRC
jgi:hypothetical protein